MLKIHCGDAVEVMKGMGDNSVQCCVTSPPYWGLRDYGVSGQLGLERTPEEYVGKMVEVFREVRRVLREDGTLWLNLGDSYARQAGDDSTKASDNGFGNGHGTGRTGKSHLLFKSGNNVPPPGLKAKDLVGIPWRVAFALQADGWWIRQDIIWHKPNPMPESVTDRCTKAHEYIFLMSKSAKYYYDAEAIYTKPSEVYANDCRWDTGGTDTNYKDGYSEAMAQNPKMPHRVFNGKRPTGINRRSVWTVPSAPYKDSHFATFPPDLIKPCIMAGSKRGDVVLDPFGGSGTTGMVALELGRKAVLIELNPEYVKLAERRTIVTPELALD